MRYKEDTFYDIMNRPNIFFVCACAANYRKEVNTMAAKKKAKKKAAPKKKATKKKGKKK